MIDGVLAEELQLKGLDGSTKGEESVRGQPNQNNQRDEKESNKAISTFDEDRRQIGKIRGNEIALPA